MFPKHPTGSAVHTAPLLLLAKRPLPVIRPDMRHIDVGQTCAARIILPELGRHNCVGLGMHMDNIWDNLDFQVTCLQKAFLV